MSETETNTATPKQQPAIQPLSRDRHGDKGWTRFSSYGFAASQSVVPLSAAEVGAAALELPLGFVKHDKGWQLVAVLGLAPGQNLFIEPTGRWHGSYVPAGLRSYPFRIGRPESSDQMILCIDEASGLLVEKGGEPFFGPDGKLSEPVDKIWTFMQQVAKGQVQLDAACARFAETGIIESWPLTINTGDAKRPVEGLYRVSEEKLNALDDEAFGSLRRGGTIALAYTQMLSAGNISKLGQLADAHARHAETMAKHREMEVAAKQSSTMDSGLGFGDSFDIDWSKIS